MKFASVHLCCVFFGAAMSCDPRERSMIEEKAYAFTFFVFAVEEMSEGSFDTKLLLKLLGFRDISRDPPFVLGQVVTGAIYDHCDNAGLDMDTTFWLSPQTFPLVGALYGCETTQKRLRKVVVYNDSTWRESDLLIFCDKHQGIPPKYADDMKNCIKNANVFIDECLRSDFEKNLTKIIAMLALGIAAGVVVAFIKQLIQFRCVSTKIEIIEK